MLLPSAITCDASQPQHFLRSANAFVSPPASPPNTSSGPIGNIVSTCRSLQSLISAPTPNAALPPASLPMPTMNELPTPPMTHAMPPLKLRLRSRPTQDQSNPHTGPRKRITKRAPARGLNKRRRDVDDDMGRDDVEDGFSEGESDSDRESSYTLDSLRPLPINFQTSMPTQAPSELPPRPSTPKQSAIAPPELPLGLERADFHLHQTQDPDDASRAGTGIEIARDGEAWSVEQDRKLIEVIIAHFKLSPEDMEDCARSLGKGSGCVERRWKSLVMNGDVVLKKRERRTRLHSTWGR